MRRRIAIVLLALGTVGGYASGFACMHHRMEWRRARFERHVAAVCVDAAKSSSREAVQAAPAALPDED